MLIKGLAFKAVPQRLILLKKHSLANVLGLFLQINVSLSSIDDLLAAHNCSFILTKVMDTTDLLLLMKWHLYRQTVHKTSRCSQSRACLLL